MLPLLLGITGTILKIKATTEARREDRDHGEWIELVWERFHPCWFSFAFLRDLRE
jgi:hypothetical protein